MCSNSWWFSDWGICYYSTVNTSSWVDPLERRWGHLSIKVEWHTLGFDCVGFIFYPRDAIIHHELCRIFQAFPRRFCVHSRITVNWGGNNLFFLFVHRLQRCFPAVWQDTNQRDEDHLRPVWWPDQGSGPESYQHRDYACPWKAQAWRWVVCSGVM